MTVGRPQAGASLAAALVGAGASATALCLLRLMPSADRFDRVNHAGATVTLLEGPAYVLGGGLAAALAGPAPVVAAAGSGAFGALDDLRGDSASKGLAGHLGALARGQVTTGAIKVAGIGVTGLVTAIIVDAPTGRASSRPTAAAATLLGAGVVAGSANLGNLLDLRPGRALKASVIAAAPLLASRQRTAAAAAGAVIGTAAGLLPDDLAGRSMLGDTGANAAGALVGTALVHSLGLRGRLLALSVLAGLTLASEKVSFTRVIESTPVLRALDRLGRG